MYGIPRYFGPSSPPLLLSGNTHPSEQYLLMCGRSLE